MARSLNTWPHLQSAAKGCRSQGRSVIGHVYAVLGASPAELVRPVAACCASSTTGKVSLHVSSVSVQPCPPVYLSQVLSNVLSEQRVRQLTSSSSSLIDHYHHHHCHHQITHGHHHASPQALQVLECSPARSQLIHVAVLQPQSQCET